MQSQSAWLVRLWIHIWRQD